jgi:GH43 family beta-xylosidase
MAEHPTNFLSRKYRNPVYPLSFADPFVLKFRGEYFAYCTGDWHDGRIFGVLRSRNLVDWTEIGGAMERLPTDAPFYWSPEVTYVNGKFYLYYSVGNEALMELRVAVSNRPDGGFVDAGVKLTTEDFAIDAHLFTDDDGEKYLFYATDFLTHSHIGTGTVVDKMLDFFTLEGNPRPVTRAKYDWQVYDPNRREKGGVRWHTVEGSFVLKRKGVYYQMFSGGNWQNISYGVSFAVTDDIERNEEWLQFSDGERVLPILRTLPDLVIGPGHNSVVRGVSNRELFCVYHRWTDDGRVLAIDRQDFADTRIFVVGASFDEQIAPFEPGFVDYFDGQFLDENWRKFGEWQISGGEVFNLSGGRSELICREKSAGFLVEFSFRAVEFSDQSGRFGFCLFDETNRVFEFSLLPDLQQAEIEWFADGIFQKESFTLPADFDFRAVHLLRVEVDGFSVKLKIDEAALSVEKLSEKRICQIAFFVERMQTAFSGFALTAGFEDLFDWQNAEFRKRGWRKLTEAGIFHLENGQMFLFNQVETETVAVKGTAAADFELAFNLRLVENLDDSSAFGFLLLNDKDEIVSRLALVEKTENYYLKSHPNSFETALPANFDIKNFHQFRFLKANGKMLLQLEGVDLGEISVSTDKLKIAVFCRCSTIALEMVRQTIFSQNRER